MKAVMYHYVRPDSGGMPGFRYLHLDNFRRQLDHFAETLGFVSQKAFLDAVENGEENLDGAVLTFDDGLRDHADFAIPELISRGLWGIFYVPTGMYQSGKLLDVHRIHVLLGTAKASDVLDYLKKNISGEHLSHAHVPEYRTLTYAHLSEAQSVTEIKRILNYFISYDHRETVLDGLLAEFVPSSRCDIANYYMTPAEIRSAQASGMIIGNHSVTHPVFSKIAADTQRRELEQSFAFLEDVTGGLKTRTFAYPYGGFHSFNETSEQILGDLGCKFSFNVEPRDILQSDILGRPQALPRYDCNQFAFGAVTIG